MSMLEEAEDPKTGNIAFAYMTDFIKGMEKRKFKGGSCWLLTSH
jgi:hypothetical protein